MKPKVTIHRLFAVAAVLLALAPGCAAADPVAIVVDHDNDGHGNVPVPRATAAAAAAPT
jgi:hypothetical protein